MIEFYRYMISLHKHLPALRRGALKQLLADSQLIAYGRMHGANRCAVVINNREEGRTVEIPVWELGIEDGRIMRRLMLSHKEGYNAGASKYTVKDGTVTLNLPGYSGALLSIEE